MTEDADDPLDEDAELNEAMERATHACQMASGHVPEPLFWGAWMYSDAHPAMGGGVGGFTWFESRDEMLAFLREHLVFLDPGIGARNNVASLRDACRSVVDSVTDGTLTLRVAMTRLNHLVRGLTVIKWWGRMEDLLVGEEAFPCEVRSRFRGERVDATRESPPIPESDEREFAEFLRTMI